jgi:hypothetical protein
MTRRQKLTAFVYNAIAFYLQVYPEKRKVLRRLARK